MRTTWVPRTTWVLSTGDLVLMAVNIEEECRWRFKKVDGPVYGSVYELDVDGLYGGLLFRMADRDYVLHAWTVLLPRLQRFYPVGKPRWPRSGR